ncbi:MAG: nucleotidyl transferase AbiEii/AbiGii toxin family protein [Kofleriaceae bacterium]
MIEELHLAERVADLASSAGIETALIGATALAFHRYVRATEDIDLGASIRDPFKAFQELERLVLASGLRIRVSHEDSLGGVARIWEREDEDGEPIFPVELVNFWNPLRPRRSPATAAIRDAESIAATSLRCVRLPDLIALKCDAGGRSDLADVVELLRQNPLADREVIRARCRDYKLDVIDQLIAEADAP